MQEDDWFYHHVLHECQSVDLQHRLDALEDLDKHQYLDRVEAQFLLDRLNSTSQWQEQRAIVGLMCQMKQPLPVDALMAILADWETSTIFLRMQVAHALAVRQAKEAFELCVRLALDECEHPWLREVLTGDLALWKEQKTSELLLTLLANRQPGVCIAALEVLREWPAQAIPLDLLMPYLQREEKDIREAAIKTLMAAEQRVPIEAILSALHDPEPEVRAAASHACMSLVKWCPDQIPVDLLLEALHDEYAEVREDVLDAFGNMPLRVPVEPVIAALSDPVSYVRCAATETLGLMGERVPSSVYPVLQEMSGSDVSAHVRQRATRSLLLLHGMRPAPLRLPTIDLTLKELGE